MANEKIGNTLEGRPYKTDGSNSNTRPVTITAPIGDGSTPNSATPFIEFVGTYGSTTDGDKNITTADITGGGAAPSGTEKGLLVKVADSQYWIALYDVT
tara:strand:- start:5530 stop:5826 length:297 start_codon:yes stop_codon:yes gene_type:complete